MHIKYSYQFFALISWVLIVIALFEYVPQRKLVGFYGGIGFVLISVLILWSEFNRGSLKSRIHIVTSGAFLVLAALPIMYLRIANWEAQFSTLRFLGLPAYHLHKISFLLYLLMILSCIRAWVNQNRNK